MKKRFSEEQIIGFLKEADGGMPVVELCRKHGFSDASYYKWKAKFVGMEVSDAKRLRALEEENNKLKRLLADALLDQAGIERCGFTKVVSPQARREAVAALKTERRFSERRACGLMNISTSVLRYCPRPDTNRRLSERIILLAGQR